MYKLVQTLLSGIFRQYTKFRGLGGVRQWQSNIECNHYFIAAVVSYLLVFELMAAVLTVVVVIGFDGNISSLRSCIFIESIVCGNTGCPYLLD